MKNHVSKVSLGLAFLAAGLLSACNEPQPAGSTPSSGAVAGGDEAKATPPRSPGISPSELGMDERRVPLVAAQGCNIERANGVVFSGQPIQASKSDGAIQLSGWVANVEQRLVPPTADIRLLTTDNKRVWKISVETGGKRDDVMALLGGDAAFANAGFSGAFNLDGLPAGGYRTYLVFRDGETWKSCDNGRGFVLTD